MLSHLSYSPCLKLSPRVLLPYLVVAAFSVLQLAVTAIVLKEVGSHILPSWIDVPPRQLSKIRHRNVGRWAGLNYTTTRGNVFKKQIPGGLTKQGVGRRAHASRRASACARAPAGVQASMSAGGRSCVRQIHAGVMSRHDERACGQWGGGKDEKGMRTVMQIGGWRHDGPVCLAAKGWVG